MRYRYQWYDIGTFLLCVDSYESSIPQGQLVHPVYAESAAFSGIVQMLMKIERIMDIENLPQAFQQLRTFTLQPETAERTKPATRRTSGALATFSLHIRFRRNAGWQGTLCWLEEKQTRHFRSVLELILLLDSALSTGQMQPPQPEPPYEDAI